MSSLGMNGDWNVTSGMLKQKWAHLTDNDLEFSDGNRHELYDRIQIRTGEDRATVEKAVTEASWYSSGCE